MFIDLEYLLDPTVGDLKSLRRQAITGNNHALLILNSQNSRGQRHRQSTFRS